MSETPETPAAKKRGGLNTMLVADLKAMANGLGIAGADSMKKPQLVQAIKDLQNAHAESKKQQPQKQEQPPKQKQQDAPAQTSTDDKPAGDKSTGDKPADDQPAEKSQPRQRQRQRSQQQGQQGQQDNKQDKQHQDKQSQNQNQQNQQGQQGQQNQQDESDDDEQTGSRRNRRRRGRDRDRAARSGGRQDEPQILEDDVLVPAAGILDVLDNYAFVRTSGYLAGPDDVYLSLSLVRKFGLRRGDAVVGQVRQPREGERKEKFNPMVRVDTVNGSDPDAARNRPHFDELTPVHPSERLRLETDAANTIGRSIDLVAPIGKGQRGLIVSSGPAGKTTVLQSVAASITANNPECHLMVVLVDERPEEVTDYQRSVKGEVVASTFDHPASDHTQVAELALERAKRLVELGHDVVLLLDGLIRLGRAYQHAAPAGGRSLAGGVDATALHPVKRFFGAARTLEDGGSLTILATSLVETGSVTDEVIFEEFRGTANMELRLRGEFAEKRMFPAVDGRESWTRQEDVLLGAQEAARIATLRRELSTLSPEDAHSRLMSLVQGRR